MRFFAGSDEDDTQEDGPLFGGSDRYEQRKIKMERAREIADGTVMGTFERDEEVWAMVSEIKESK